MGTKKQHPWDLVGAYPICAKCGSPKITREASAAWSVAGAVGLVAFWEAMVRLLDVRPMILLAPSRIVSTFVDDPTPYLQDMWITARHLVIGLAISLGVSIVLGAALAAVRPLEHAAQPLLVLIMVTPWVAYITSVVLVVGSGQPAVVFLVAFVTIPAFVYATVGGMRGADQAALDESHWNCRPCGPWKIDPC